MSDRSDDRGGRQESGGFRAARHGVGSSKSSGARQNVNPGDPRQKRRFKEFPLSSFAINHPTSVIVMTIILIIAGLMSYITVPKESMPEFVVPNVIVNTIYPGVAPGDMETLITQPLEDELNTIADVKTILSTSIEGVSSINVEFEAGVDMRRRSRRSWRSTSPSSPSCR